MKIAKNRWIRANRPELPRWPTFTSRWFGPASSKHYRFRSATLLVSKFTPPSA